MVVIERNLRESRVHRPCCAKYIGHRASESHKVINEITILCCPYSLVVLTLDIVDALAVSSTSYSMKSKYIPLVYSLYGKYQLQDSEEQA